MTYVDQAIARVRVVARRIGKKPFARRIGASDTLLRGAEDDSWNPTVSTLRSFEKAIQPGEDSADCKPSHAEQKSRIPRRAGRA